MSGELMLAIIQFVVFFLGGWLYLFSTGVITKGPISEKWRLENKSWLTPMSLILAIVMLLNVLLSISDLVSKAR